MPIFYKDQKEHGSDIKKDTIKPAFEQTETFSMLRTGMRGIQHPDEAQS